MEMCCNENNVRHKMHHRRADSPPVVHFVPQTNRKIVHQK